MEPLVHRPPGDLLQEIFERGPGGFLRLVGLYASAPPAGQVAILLAGLSLGPPLEGRIHALLASQESAEKRLALLGLGAMGHPLAEGYLARIVREKPEDDAVIAALRGLGRIAGPKSLPLVLAALDHPFFFPHACAALARYRHPAATAALLDRASDPVVRRALADAGVPGAEGLFRGLLAGPGPADADALRWAGNAGDAASAAHLVAPVEAEDRGVARAAFEAYAALGAPLGVEPLLRRAERAFEPWMVAAFGNVDHPEAHRFLLDRLEAPPPRGLLRRLLGRSRSRPLEPVAVYRALRRAAEPEVVARLAARLEQEAEPAAVAEILDNRGLLDGDQHLSAVRALWRGGRLLVRHLAARALVQRPDAEFLAEALGELGRPALVALDDAPAGADPERLLEVFAREHNPCLLLGDFLGAGLLDLGELDRELGRSFAERAYPRATPLRTRFGRPEDEGVPELFEAVGEAHPAMAEPLSALWSLLAHVEQRGDPILNLFLSWTETHRGGLRRTLARNVPAAVARFIAGKTDRDLPSIDDLADHAPQQGRLAGEMREMLDRARRALMAECRDIALMVEGQARGDMVLIEEL